MDDIAAPHSILFDSQPPSDRPRPIILVMFGQPGLLITRCWAVSVLRCTVQLCVHISGHKRKTAR